MKEPDYQLHYYDESVICWFDWKGKEYAGRRPCHTPKELFVSSEILIQAARATFRFLNGGRLPKRTLLLTERLPFEYASMILRDGEEIPDRG